MKLHLPRFGSLMTLLSLLACRALSAENVIFETIEQVNLNGFIDTRGGMRLQNDKEQKGTSVIEIRLQLDAELQCDCYDLKYKVDLTDDAITEETGYQTRALYWFSRPAEYIDLKIGRQIITWGTGEWVFLNDLFPKDWQSFFIGRDKEYLKYPSDALKLSLFSTFCNLDIVYTPRFNPDNDITGEYISENKDSDYRTVEQPDDWFSDDETAIRVHKIVKGYELALYGYHGFWKMPRETEEGLYKFSSLNVYGGSIRGPAYGGIANLEFAYYDSTEDRDGSDSFIPNSELRYLAGYMFDPAQDFSISIQYYIKRMLQFSEYRNSNEQASSSERTRQLLTVTFTRLMMNQNLELLIPFIYSPDDGDIYIRPVINYKYTDNISFEFGANIFAGHKHNGYFHNLSDNTSVYLAFKYFF